MKQEVKVKAVEYLKLCGVSVILGGLIGLVVGLYQLGIQYVSSWSKQLYTSTNGWLIFLVIVLVIAASLLNYLIISYRPSLDGSGIPNMELGIRHKREIDWKKDIVLMIINSYLSTFAGFPLGSEGPSVVVSGKLARMTEDITNVRDEETVAMACGTGFGCAFLSPLAGLCYIFEESLHKFNPQLIFRACLMSISAFCTTYFINHHHLLEIEEMVLPQLNEYYVFIFLVIFNAGFGMLFTKAIIALKRFFTHHENKLWAKYRGFVLFALILVLNFVCVGYMGSGASIAHSIIPNTTLWIIALIFVLRFVMTTLSGSGKVTGGLVVPIMTLGALTGQFAMSLCHQCFGLNMAIAPLINLISMCMIFGVVTKTPITSIVLVYSAIGYSTGDYLHAFIIIPIAAVSIFLAFFISKWCKVDCLYELFMDIALEKDKKITLEEK